MSTNIDNSLAFKFIMHCGIFESIITSLILCRNDGLKHLHVELQKTVINDLTSGKLKFRSTKLEQLDSKLFINLK
jgi:hypothetical protein